MLGAGCIALALITISDERRTERRLTAKLSGRLDEVARRNTNSLKLD